MRIFSNTLIFCEKSGMTPYRFCVAGNSINIHVGRINIRLVMQKLVQLL